MAKSGYVNGDDVLLMVGGKCIGHCSTHSVNYTSEVKDRAVKPVMTAKMSSGKFKERSVTGLDITASASGLRFYGETESSFAALRKAWMGALPIECKFFERNENGGDAVPAPYLVGMFVISSLSEDNPSKEDVTYQIELQISGEPTVWDDSKLTPGEPNSVG